MWRDNKSIVRHLRRVASLFGFVMLTLVVSESQGQESPTLQQARAAAKASPGKLQTQIAFAEALLEARKLGQARRVYAYVRRLHKGEVAGAYGMAKIQIAEERIRAARGSCRKLIQAHLGRPEGHLCLGYTFLAWKRAARAQEPFEAALKMGSAKADAWIGLGEVHRLRLDVKKAENAYRQALKLDANRALAHFGLGQLYASVRRPDDAQRELRAAIALNPGLAEPHYHLGRLLMPSAEASAALAKAAEIRPGWAQALEAWGKNLGQLGQHEKAIDVLKRAVAAQPNLAPAHHQLGLSHAALKQWTPAERSLNKAIKLVPSLSPAMMALAKVLVEQGRHREALDLYRQARSITPNDAHIPMAAGRVMRDLSRNTQALAQFRRAGQLDPSWAAPEVEQGDVYYGMEAFQTARIHYEEAAKRPNRDGIDENHLQQRLQQLQQ